MKKRTILRLAATLCAILSLLCLPGCQSRSPTRYFSYLDSPAHATLTGKINGIPFAATLYGEGRGGTLREASRGDPISGGSCERRRILIKRN
ncbi:MAG: hypothetical protein IJW09_04065, partial [Clostridia bacterium]|nr:hypothetical protein [Clostridia bacterium]